jgi:hypothetical protein
MRHPGAWINRLLQECATKQLAADAGAVQAVLCWPKTMQNGWPAGSVKNPEARLAFTWNTGGAQSEQFLFGLVRVAHADVQVHLLRVGRVGPARLNPVGSALKGQLAQARPAVAGDLDRHLLAGHDGIAASIIPGAGN